MPSEGKQPDRNLWIKPLRAPLGTAQFERLRGLDRFHESVNGRVFRCVHYYGFSEKHLSMEKIEGHALSRLLARAGAPYATPRTRDTARKLADLAGSWLSHFHRSELGSGQPTYDSDSLVNRTLRNIELLCRAGLPEGLAGRLRDLLKAASCERPSNLEVTLHGDFKPGNLMIGESEIVGVDMEGCHRGHPLADLGSFMAACAVLRSSSLLWCHCPRWWRLLCKEFLAGYGAVAECSPMGLRLQLLMNVVALFEYMSRWYAYPVWYLRGRPLMVRTVSELLNNPLADAQKT